MHTLRTIAAILFPISLPIIVVIWWFLPTYRWKTNTWLLLLFVALVSMTVPSLFLGDIVLVYVYRIIIITIPIIAYISTVLSNNQNGKVVLLKICTLIIVLIIATLLRYVPRAETIIACELQHYGAAITAYHTSNGHYPTDIYARNQDDLATLRRNIKDDIEDICTARAKLPLLILIRYDLQSPKYLLRGYYPYDPLFLTMPVYRVCSYDPASQQVQCHLQLTQPFDLPLGNY